MNNDQMDLLVNALVGCFTSPNVPDSNMEAANLVDVGEKVANRLKSISHAITAPAAGGTDATGGHVESLTEAVMGITEGLTQIAAALESVARAIREGQ